MNRGEPFIEHAEPSKNPADIKRWYAKLVALSAEIPQHDHERMRIAIAEQDREAKKYIRKMVLGSAILMILVVGISSSLGQSPLPVVDGVDARALRLQCRELLDAMARIKASLPQETDQRLRELIKDEKNVSDESAAKIQKFLNDQCLVGVSINPESRVKAARGPRSAELVAGKESVVLVRVVNDAGVTHALSLEGPQIIGPNENAKERWLHATVYPEHPSSQKLSGQKVEYVLLRLKTEKPGKREATLVFDVGQGTQDLGFRAEVPILFTISQ